MGRSWRKIAESLKGGLIGLMKDVSGNCVRLHFSQYLSSHAYFKALQGPVWQVCRADSAMWAALIQVEL